MSIITGLREHAKYLITENITDNPIVTRDFRTRMRGKQGFVIMGSYVMFLILVMTIAYYTTWSTSSMSGTQSIVNLNLGATLFKTLTWTQTVLLALIIPSLTAGALTLELEKRTIEMLALTRLTAGKIVIGKHLAGVVYPIVLLLCSLPLSGICIMLGGISPAEIVVTYLALGAWAFLFSAVGIYWSSVFNKNATAALFAYGTCLFYFLFTSWALMIFSYGGYRSGAGNPFWSLNPGMAITMGILESAPICGIKIIGSLAVFVLHILLGVILVLTASTHVKYLRAERALPIRILLLILTAMMVWLYAGKENIMVSTAPGSAGDGLYAPMITLLVAFSFIAAVIATGIPKYGEKPGFLYGLSPKRMFKSDLAGSVGFMLLWSVFSFAVLAGTLYWNSAASHAFSFSKIIRPLLTTSVSCIAVIGGISALGVWISAGIKQRRSAGAITALIALFVLAGYSIVIMVYSAVSSTSANAIWQFAAFWPITPLMALTDNGWNAMPDLWWTRKTAWLVCTIIYSFIGLVAMMLASRSASKITRIVEE